MSEPKMTKDDKVMEESVGTDNKPKLQDNRDEGFLNGAFSKEQNRKEDTKDKATPPIDPLKHQEYDPDANPLQGTSPDKALPNNDLSETSTTNQEELDLPRFGGSTLSGQPKNGPERNFPNH